MHVVCCKPRSLRNSRTLRSSQAMPLAGRNFALITGFHMDEKTVGKKTIGLLQEAGARVEIWTPPSRNRELLSQAKQADIFGREPVSDKVQYYLSRAWRLHRDTNQPTDLGGLSEGGWCALRLAQHFNDHPEFEAKNGEIIGRTIAINPPSRRPWHAIFDLPSAVRLAALLPYLIFQGRLGLRWRLPESFLDHHVLNDPRRSETDRDRIRDLLVSESGRALWEFSAVVSPSHWYATRLKFRLPIRKPILLIGSRNDHINPPWTIRHLAAKLAPCFARPDIFHTRMTDADHHFFDSPAEEPTMQQAIHWLAAHPTTSIRGDH